MLIIHPLFVGVNTFCGNFIDFFPHFVYAEFARKGVISMEFKDRFKELRLQSGLSQVEMANKLHISKSAVGAYETGDRTPTFSYLIELSDRFGVSIDWLVGKTVIEHTPRPLLSDQQQRMLAYANKLNEKGITQLIAIADALSHTPDYVDSNQSIDTTHKPRPTGE